MRLKYVFILIALMLMLTLFLAPQVSAQGTELEIEVTQPSYLIFQGDRLAVTVSLTNVGDASSIQNVVLRSSSGEEAAVGVLGPAVTQNVTFYIQNYGPGKNQAEVYATYLGGETTHKSIWFEVRPPNESVTLRVVNAPQSMYEGGNYTAQVQVQNLWQNAVSGVRIKNGNDVLYYVGVLNPNQSLNVNLRVPGYQIGKNSLQLVVEDERGTAPPVPLTFEVIPADYAVSVYLASLNPATYPSETLMFSLVVAASEVAGVRDLEIRALNAGVQPTGYFLGEQTAQQQQAPTVDIQSLLSGQSQTEQQTQQQEGTQKAVRGQVLDFQLQDPSVGTKPLSFQIFYRIGSVAVQREFTIDALVVGTPTMRLIQAQRIVATKGDEALVLLHVANDLPVEVDAVSVVPVGDFEASPSEFFIGSMSPNDFLPANFKVETSTLKDGDPLSFKLAYRIGRQTYETQPIYTVVHLEEPQKTSPLVYIVPIVVFLLLVLLWWFSRRKKWTQSRS